MNFARSQDCPVHFPGLVWKFPSESELDVSESLYRNAGCAESTSLRLPCLGFLVEPFRAMCGAI